MKSAEKTDYTSELEQRLAAADSQLALYARDLREACELQRALSRELAVANELLKIHDRLKTDFLTFISHELRTPLSAMSIVTALGNTSDPHEQAELLEIVQNGYTRLNGFIVKGLEYFEWLAVRQIGARHHIHLEGLLEAAWAHVQGAEERDDDLVIETRGKLDGIEGDPHGIGRLLAILLENSIRFSPEGSPISARILSEGDSVVLSLTDAGSGFSPEAAEELFEPFTVGDVLHHSRGSGLSLALARAIAEAHCGSLVAESRGPGTGATFTLTLPAAETTAVHEAGAPAVASSRS
jgi:two-component system CheB/CheR fusion protein